MDPPAAYTEPIENGGRLRCGLCPHNCAIDVGELGDCRTRRNKDGEIRVLTYGRLLAAARDPVEKKPLFHYRPGSSTFSVASAGCNLICPFCQNHSLSQALRNMMDGRSSGGRWKPAEVVKAACEHGCESISFTYSEPMLQFEFARDVAGLALPEQVDIVFVTNGQVNARPAEEIAGFVAAANVDLKSFSAAAYKEVLGGSLKATVRTIEIFAKAGVWTEVTTLVIPGFNDSDDELASIARFIARIDPKTPWHVSRFHADYLWTDRPATPVETIRRAREIGAAEGLCHVYCGNIHGDDGEKTKCPSCGNVAIDRMGYRLIEVDVRAGKCLKCGEQIAGKGMP